MVSEVSHGTVHAGGVPGQLDGGMGGRLHGWVERGLQGRLAGEVAIA